MYSLTYSLTLTHTCPYTHTHLPLSRRDTFFHMHKKKNYESVDWALLRCFVRLSQKLLLHSQPRPEYERRIVIMQNLLWLNDTSCHLCLKMKKKISKNAQEVKQQMWHTCFEAGLVDFNLPSDWLSVLQVGEVVEGFWAGGGTGVAVGHGLPGTVRPPTLDLIVHSHQLEETNTQRLKLRPEYSKILNIVCKRSKMNKLSSR